MALKENKNTAIKLFSSFITSAVAAIQQSGTTRELEKSSEIVDAIEPGFSLVELPLLISNQLIGILSGRNKASKASKVAINCLPTT